MLRILLGGILLKNAQLVLSPTKYNNYLIYLDLVGFFLNDTVHILKCIFHQYHSVCFLRKNQGSYVFKLFALLLFTSIMPVYNQ
jgi:hypothetical protein